MTDSPTGSGLCPEREQKIRADGRHVFVGSLIPGKLDVHADDCFGCQRDDLLAEIDRLRAERAGLVEAGNALANIPITTSGLLATSYEDYAEALAGWRVVVQP